MEADRLSRRNIVSSVLALLLAMSFCMVSKTTTAQTLPPEEAPFYNAIYGGKVVPLNNAIRELAAERANANTTPDLISLRLNNLMEGMLKHDLDVDLVARLGLRLRIAFGFFETYPFGEAHFHTSILEIEALLKLNRKQDAVQAALPVFRNKAKLIGFKPTLVARWQAVEARLLNGRNETAQEFQKELQTALKDRQALQQRLSALLKDYAVMRQASPKISTEPDPILALAENIFKTSPGDLPFKTDVASMAAWAAYYKQDFKKAQFWLEKIEHEKPLFLTAIPIHPAGVYSWMMASPNLSQLNNPKKIRDYAERAFTLLKLQYDGKGFDVANSAITLASNMRLLGQTKAAALMRAHALTLIDDQEPGAGHLLVRLALETTLVDRFTKSEQLFSRALNTKDAKGPQGNAVVEGALRGWADMLLRASKLEQAHSLYERLVKIDHSKPGGPTRNSIDYLLTLSVIADQQKSDGKEKDYARRAQVLAKRLLSPDDPLFQKMEANRIIQSIAVAKAVNSLNGDGGRNSAKTQSENSTASVLVKVANLQSKLARAIINRKPLEAKKYLAELRAAVPDQILFNAGFATFAAQISLLENDFESALGHFREATQSALAPGTSNDSAETESLFASHAMVAVRVAANRPREKQDALLNEAFRTVQHATMLSVGQALSRAQERFSNLPSNANDARDANTIRLAQDTELEIGRARMQLLDLLANGKDASALQQTIAKLEEKLTNLRKSSGRSTTSFLRPEPFGLNETTDLLEPNEGLILIATVPQFATDQERPSLIFTLTRNQAGYRNLSFSTTERREQLEDISRRLRCQAALTDPACGKIRANTRGAMTLDEEEPKGDKAPEFDFQLAYQAYQLLMEPYAKTLTDKKRLIIIPDKSLVSMPFHLMITEPPNENTTLENAPWLIRSHAITVVPSVAGFHAFRKRQLAKRDGLRSFFGVGDPLIGRQRNGPLPYDCGTPSTEPVLVAQNLDTSRVNTRSGTADTRALLDLQELPDTRCELEAGAEAAGGERKVLLHDQATETAIKNLSKEGVLARFDILSFATHGLIAGELGQNHAGLVFTPPHSPSPQDDGLLTTAEISALRLNADFVLLSACNTAAPDRAGQEGLSGMASAFFHAGARSLLVSHWPVYSDAATRLTTELFRQRRANPGIDKGQAQQRAILSIINNPNATSRELHPAYWAPFMLIGDSR